MNEMGPAAASRLEPRRSEDRQPQERHARKGAGAKAEKKFAGQVEEDCAEGAAAEPEKHQLDERA